MNNMSLGKWCRNRERNVEAERIHWNDGEEESRGKEKLITSLKI